MMGLRGQRERAQTGVGERWALPDVLLVVVIASSLILAPFPETRAQDATPAVEAPTETATVEAALPDDGVAVGAGEAPAETPVAAEPPTQEASATATEPAIDVTPSEVGTESVDDVEVVMPIAAVATPTQTVTAAPTEHAARTSRGFEAAAATPPTPPALGALIHVRLVDQNGMPVPGATFRVLNVLLLVAAGTTDADGDAYISTLVLGVALTVQPVSSPANCLGPVVPASRSVLLNVGGTVAAAFTTTCTTPSYANTVTATCQTLPTPRLRIGQETGTTMGSFTVTNTGPNPFAFEYDLVDTRGGGTLVVNAGTGSVNASQASTRTFGTTMLASDATNWSVQRSVKIRFKTPTGRSTGMADVTRLVDCAFEPFLAISLDTSCPTPTAMLPGANFVVGTSTSNTGDAPLGSTTFGATIAGTFGASTFTHAAAPADFLAGVVAGDLTASATGTPPAGSTGAAVYPGYTVSSTRSVSCAIGRSAPAASGTNVVLPTIPFSLSPQTTAGTLTVTASNSGVAGWNVTIQVGPFAYSGSGFGLAISNAAFAVVSAPVPSAAPAGQPAGGAGGPNPPAGAFGALGASRTLLSANAGNGIGVYTQSVGVQLNVPGGSVSGTYTANIVITASAGP